MSGVGPRRPVGRPLGPRAERLAALAGSLGVDLPLFDGPLVAFKADGQGSEDPVFLAGDLQAVHPKVEGRPSVRDPSLQSAIVTLTDHEHETLDLAVIEGIWGTRIEGDRLATATYFSLTDSGGRIRTWLLLPPPRLIVGIAHLWVPSVPPSVDPRERADDLPDG